ncbi:MAG: alpha/beta hydrolase [Candidatus Saccharimonadaceae bacterium]
MKNCFLFTLLFSFVTTLSLHAAKVDTVRTYSTVMKKEIPAVVITPDTYDNQTQFPVLYLLHGYSGDYAGWVNSADVKSMADQYNMIIVCPDGNYSSWYFDSPMDSTSRYDTYVAKELTAWIDKNFKTIPKKEARAITGLSMGGHGALYLAFRHQDLFGACGSMSGGVDIRPFPNNWDMTKHLGDQRTHPENWENNTVINMLHLLTPNSLQIIIDCGTEDFFYNVNVRLHNELAYRNIPHTFISRPGEHNWDFWKMSVKYQAMFFSNYFNQTT